MMNKKHKPFPRFICFFFAAAIVALVLALAACMGRTDSDEADASSVDAASQQAEVLATLTDDELQSLISGKATLESLAESRAASASASSGTASSSVSTDGAASEDAAASSEDAATSSEAQDAEASTSSSTSASTSGEAASSSASEAAYEAELRALIAQLYDVKARAESGLNSAIASAKAEYKALPADKQTQTRKIAICMGKAGELKSLESSCDAEVNDIVAKMRTVLTENGQSTALADEALASYKTQKTTRYNSLMNGLYS